MFKGLNVSFNLDRNETADIKEFIREHFQDICGHFLCMILYEDHGLEHLAQV